MLEFLRPVLGSLLSAGTLVVVSQEGMRVHSYQFLTYHFLAYSVFSVHSDLLFVQDVPT